MSKGIVAETLGEIQGERMLWVDTKFIEKWAEIMCNFRSSPKIFEDYKLPIKTMLREAGISIKK